jgi:hypothetical protein
VNAAKLSGVRSFSGSVWSEAATAEWVFFRDCFKNGFAGSDCNPSRAIAKSE